MNIIDVNGDRVIITRDDTSIFLLVDDKIEVSIPYDENGLVTKEGNFLGIEFKYNGEILSEDEASTLAEELVTSFIDDVNNFEPEEDNVTD